MSLVSIATCTAHPDLNLNANCCMIDSVTFAAKLSIATTQNLFQEDFIFQCIDVIIVFKHKTNHVYFVCWWSQHCTVHGKCTQFLPSCSNCKQKLAHLAAWKNDKTITLWFVFVHIKESGHKLITVANKSMFSHATFLVLLFLHENVHTGNTEIISAFKQCLRQKSDRRCVTCYWQRSLYISCCMGAGVYNAYCYDHSSYLCYTWYRTCGMLATSLLWV